MITFSVICPIYNAEKTLSDAIGSILLQSYSNWNLILIDDGSTDDSGAICDKFAANDKRIKVIHQENQGQSAARLKGIRESNGDYILFLDSDDFFEPNALEILVKELNSVTVDVVLYNAEKKTNNELENIYCLDEKETFYDGNKILFECFANRTAGYFWTYCFKKELFDIPRSIENKYSKIQYSEDVYLIYQIIKNNVESLTTLPLCLYTYVVNDNSITHTQTVDKVKDRFEVFNEVYEDLVSNQSIIPTKFVKTNIGWTYLSYLSRAAKDYDYSRFKVTSSIIRSSFIFKKMSRFKKDKFNSLIHFLFKMRMYKKTYSIIRGH